ncbi:MAG: hypothetical protein V4683_19095 [Bacteroidota bacterium]
MENQEIKKPTTVKTAQKQTPKTEAVGTEKKETIAKKKVTKKPIAKVVTSSAIAPYIAPKTQAPKVANEKSTFKKVIEAGKLTGNIVAKAGGKILVSSLKTTKAIAGIYSKAGKKALEMGKELMDDTTKVMTENQKVISDTASKAIKETVSTIKESNLIENPLKGILKGKKK